MRIFYTDFNSGAPSQFQGIATTVGVEGFNGIGTGNNRFGGNFLRNATGGSQGGGGSVGAPQIRTVLTLTGLPEHNSIDLNFLFAAIDSWDGSEPPYGPDVFNVVVDGRTIFRELIVTSSYNPRPGVFLRGGNFGFDGNRVDFAYNLGLDPTFDNIPHTSSSLTIEWFADGSGWSGGTDESWGIDNVEVLVNNPTPPPSRTPSISIQNASIREGNSGTRNMVFNVRLSGRSSETITADYITGNGTARALLDYDARSGRISFRPGRTTGTISIPIRGDRLFEGNETFSVSLRNPRNARAGDLRATGTILNDDTRRRNIDILSLGKSDSITQLSKASDSADVFAVDTVV